MCFSDELLARLTAEEERRGLLFGNYVAPKGWRKTNLRLPVELLVTPIAGRENSELCHAVEYGKFDDLTKLLIGDLALPSVYTLNDFELTGEWHLVDDNEPFGERCQKGYANITVNYRPQLSGFGILCNSDDLGTFVGIQVKENEGILYRFDCVPEKAHIPLAVDELAACHSPSEMAFWYKNYKVVRSKFRYGLLLDDALTFIPFVV